MYLKGTWKFLGQNFWELNGPERGRASPGGVVTESKATGGRWSLTEWRTGRKGNRNRTRENRNLNFERGSQGVSKNYVLSTTFLFGK